MWNFCNNQEEASNVFDKTFFISKQERFYSINTLTKPDPLFKTLEGLLPRSVPNDITKVKNVTAKKKKKVKNVSNIGLKYGLQWYNQFQVWNLYDAINLFKVGPYKALFLR